MAGQDPFELDRKIAGAARAWRRYRRELRSSDARDHVFESAGAFATPELWRGLQEDRSPLGPALARWVHRLLEQHAHLGPIAAAEQAYRRAREPVLVPSPAELAPREIVRQLLLDRDRRSAWLEALARHGGALRDRRLELWQRRLELGERLGSATVPEPRLLERADAWLLRTQGAFESLAIRDLPRLVEVALASAAHASYPSRLSLRSLVELLDATRWFEGLELDVELPERIGPASFARGLAELGAAFRRATRKRSLPFVLTADPFELPERTLGGVFACLPLSEPFAMRRLEVSRHALPDHRRAWASSVLVASRMAALRLLLVPALSASLPALEQRFQELAERAFGIELDPRLAAVLFAPRSGEAARFSSWFTAASLSRELVERHDEDWFRNPRAREELREGAELPMQFELDRAALDNGASELSITLSNAL